MEVEEGLASLCLQNQDIDKTLPFPVETLQALLHLHFNLAAFRQIFLKRVTYIDSQNSLFLYIYLVLCHLLLLPVKVIT